MTRPPLYEHAWTDVVRPQPVLGLLLDLRPSWRHAVSSNPVMQEFDVTTVHDLTRQFSYQPLLGAA